jgi:hypothetical protein
MHAREHVIRDRFAERACPHCGASYVPDAVVVLARRRSLWVVMASCRQCPRRDLYVVSFGQEGQSARPFDVAEAAALIDSDLAGPPSFTKGSPGGKAASRRDGSALAPVTEADVHSMRDFLERFTGDFQTLFSSRRPRLADDTP